MKNDKEQPETVDPSKANKLDSLITKYACSEYQHVANEPQFDCEMVEFQRPDLYKLLNEYASQHSYTEQKWVSCTDKMPETESLLLTTSKKILIGDWYSGVWRVAGKIRWKEKLEGGFELLSDLNTGDVTHWKPMPLMPDQELTTPPTYTQEQMIAFGEHVKESCMKADRWSDIFNIDISKLLKTI